MTNRGLKMYILFIELIALEKYQMKDRNKRHKQIIKSETKTMKTIITM